MSAEAFKAARDFLFAHRTDYRTAHRDFRWPKLEHFNYALDWFDAELARGPLAHQPALKIVGDGAATRSFAELSAASNRIANGLRALGVQRGDRILLMLGNVVPLWETMLAAMKLGAVVIPATTLLTPRDLQDRFERGRVRHLVAAAADAAKFAGLDPGVTRIARRRAPAGWHRYDDAAATRPTPSRRTAPTRATDPLLLYFTSGTTSRPKLVEHSHQSYPVGHLITMYWIGLQPGDMHLNISSPGWAKHAYSCFFAPWNAGATVFIANQPRFNARGMLDAIAGQQRHHALRPADGLAHVRAGGPEVLARRRCARSVPPASRSTRRSSSRCRRSGARPCARATARPRPPLQIGCFPGETVKPGSMGQEAPGYRIRLLDPDGNAGGQEGEVCIAARSAAGRADARLPERRRHRSRRSASGAYRTGDVGDARRRRLLTYVGRADDVFKASDYRISPFELESVLIEHPAVAEAAVVPAPDPMRMAVPKAYITLAAGAPPDRATALSIFRHLRERLAPFKRVRRLEFSELPKTISGKIRRVELRQTEERLAKDGPARGRRIPRGGFFRIRLTSGTGMSEYQYYEFQAVDRPLDADARDALREISSRAQITATSFSNEYNYGDLKADPRTLLEKYFDLLFYTGFWSTRQFAMRVPARLIDRAAIERFAIDDEFLTVEEAGDTLIIDVTRSEMDIEPSDDTRWLVALAPLRSAVLAGDLRFFYLLWLMQVEFAGLTCRTMRRSRCRASLRWMAHCPPGPSSSYRSDLLAAAAECGAQATAAGRCQRWTRSCVHSATRKSTRSCARLRWRQSASRHRVAAPLPGSQPCRRTDAEPPRTAGALREAARRIADAEEEKRQRRAEPNGGARPRRRPK